MQGNEKLSKVPTSVDEFIEYDDAKERSHSQAMDLDTRLLGSSSHLNNEDDDGDKEDDFEMLDLPDSGGN